MSEPIVFGSVCSGIEAASEAFLPLGWRCAFVSEIDAQASAVLSHHYPETPNIGDMESIDGSEWGQVDLLIGGTPCQSFSLAGKRKSLSDARGNLSLSFVRLAHAINAVRCSEGKRPLVVVWENVPGVLSTSDNAFGCLLAGFVGSDSPVVSTLERGRWPDAGLVAGPLARVAWRVLDAQYFGLAQRRERVLVVVSFEDGPDPASILFEPRGLSRNPPARRKAGEEVAGILGGSSQSGGFRTTDLDNQGAFIPERVGLPDVEITHDASTSEADATEALRALRRAIGEEAFAEWRSGIFDSFQAPEILRESLHGRGIRRQTEQARCGLDDGSLSRAENDSEGAMSEMRLSGRARRAPQGRQLSQQLVKQLDSSLSQLPSEGAQPAWLVLGLRRESEGPRLLQSALRPVQGRPTYRIRRLVPTECERLMGFPDNYTLVPWKGKLASDSARYRQLGNSMAVPVISWLGRRIEAELRSIS